MALLAKLFHQSPDGCLAAGEAVFGYQPVVDPFGGVVLFPGFELGVFIQAASDEGYHILGKHGGFPGVVLPIPGNAVAIPVFLDGIAGDVERCGYLPLAHAVQPHLANLFVNLHCNNHLWLPPYIA